MNPDVREAFQVNADFRPRRFLRGGHLQTIVGNYLRRADLLPAAVPYLVEVAPRQTA